jgi:putative FmdB family regulatory protein
MPMYEYFCRECGTTLEKLRPADDRDLAVTCPNDPTHKPKRLLSVFAAHTGGSREPAASGRTGGGCACGGNCGCGH